MSRAFRVLLAVCLLTLCLVSPLGAAPPYVIGVVYWSMAIPGQVAMRHGLEAAAAEINRSRPARPVRLIPFVGGDGETGIRNQIAAMARLVKLRPDAIILQPIDSAALSKPVQEANRANIQVVAYDQYVLKGKLACYLTSNNALAGYLDGEYLAYRFRARTAKNPLRLVIVEYPYVSSTVERVEGLQDALADAGVPYRIVARYEAVEPKGGFQAGRAIAKRHPRGSVDAVFCVNDGGGLSVMRALKEAGRDDILMATIDGDPAAVRTIAQGGPIAIDTAQFCGALGAESLRVTYRLLKGERIPKEILMTVFPITRESLGAYPGWGGVVPPVIRRPWPPHRQVPGNLVRW
ncbi:sugar ABC transporter substrate-binding protein [bacterium]|nr:sugar ABC transporter substrate-binding protein [bacterium]